MKILIVEDDLNLGYMIADLLKVNNHDVMHVSDGNAAIPEFNKFNPDIILMDVNLNCNINGFEIARQIRTSSMTPVIFITNKTEFEDLREGFNIRNVDYLKKPFSYGELMLRANELKGRQTNFQEEICQKIDLGSYIYLPFESLLKSDAEEIKLSFQENSLLKILCRNKNQVVYKESILKDMWEEDFYRHKESSLNNIISGLRKKLKDKVNIDIINIPKTGWKLDVK
jgi:two-component system OmpR family response regulator